ncbi:MAG: hypothetical protein WBP33_17540 [Saprospiraceae bacterium]|nr:hypothetical protein [Saprospiraceae bacterium]
MYSNTKLKVLSFIICALCIDLIYSQCNTYVIDYRTSVTCPSCLDLSSCTNGFGSGLAVKNFTDAPPPGYGAPVTSVSLFNPIGRCPGSFNGLINGVNVGSPVQTVTCSCGQDICGPTNVTNFVGQPAGYVVGGNNTFQVTSTGVQVCYKTIEVTVCYTSTSPALGEWGLINFGLLLLGVGTIFIMQKQRLLGLNNGGTVEQSSGFSINLFVEDIKSNLNLLVKTYLVVLAGFTTVFAVSVKFFEYTMTNADFPCSLIAAAIISVVIQSILVNRSK